MEDMMEKDLKTTTFYKHFKGKDLIEKNIYLIIATCVSEKDFYEMKVKYVGDNRENINYNDLVIYLNYFQNQLFAREYYDLVKELSKEQQIEYNQKYRIEELTKEEVKEILDDEYKKAKLLYLERKYNKG